MNIQELAEQAGMTRRPSDRNCRAPYWDVVIDAELASFAALVLEEAAKPQPLSDSQSLEIFNDLERFMDQIEDEEITDEHLAGESLRFILDRVAAIRALKGAKE